MKIPIKQLLSDSCPVGRAWGWGFLLAEDPIAAPSSSQYLPAASSSSSALDGAAAAHGPSDTLGWWPHPLCRRLCSWPWDKRSPQHLLNSTHDTKKPWGFLNSHRGFNRASLFGHFDSGSYVFCCHWAWGYLWCVSPCDTRALWDTDCLAQNHVRRLKHHFSSCKLLPKVRQGISMTHLEPHHPKFKVGPNLCYQKQCFSCIFSQ